MKRVILGPQIILETVNVAWSTSTFKKFKNTYIT